MENDKNYFLVGVFVIVFLLAGLGFSLWLTAGEKGDFVDYRIRFSESVSGLERESMVTFRGVNVGHVKKIAIDPGNSRLIIVDIHVLKSTPVKSDTTATLKLHGLTGDVYVELTGGNDNAPDLYKTANNGELPEIKAEPSSINAIMNRLPQLLDKANHIADQISRIFSDENVQLVNNAIHQLADHFGIKAQPPKQGATAKP